MSLALIAALPFLGALVPGLFGGADRRVIAAACAAFSLMALGLVLADAPRLLAGEVLLETHRWIPQLQLTVGLRLDGLGLLFAGLILGMGLLIQLFACFYLDKAEPVARFFAFLMLFQGAMLGIVLSDNILLLLLFWELTSLTSFLLIGFRQTRPEARQGARLALAVTGAGGLVLMAGLLILGHVAGSYALSDILQAGPAIKASPLYRPALILILIGCFAKSAQVPFHFWLPQAMAAPTPVSAYLHSATMVKAGIFLMARLSPVLAGTPDWFAIVTTVGLVTLLLGAWVALFQTDLKAILAWSTVSQLGLITLLLGIATPLASMAAVFHILNHAVFKAALFMNVGCIEHGTQARDLRNLGGLAGLMPVTASVATLSGLSLAGVPPLNGFLSKEMLLQAASGTVWAGMPFVLPVLVTLAAMLSVAYALRYLWCLFYRPAPRFTTPPHEPAFGLWLAPAVLVLPVIALGLAPGLAEPLLSTAAANVMGAPVAVDLKLWHGLTPALILSMVALAGGAALIWRPATLTAIWQAVPLPEATKMFDRCMAALIRLSDAIAERVHDARLSRTLSIFLLATLVAGTGAFLTGTILPGLRIPTPLALVPVIGCGLLITATAALLLLHRNRLLSLLLVAVVGLIISLGFFYFSAPDLAMTQIGIEVVTVLVMLLALNLLPDRTPRESSRPRRWRDAGIAVAVGGGVAALTQAILTRDPRFDSISDYHLANSHDLGGGNNVVNVILVDFRGYDTFGEIVVLAIAALILVAICQTLVAGQRLLTAARPVRAGDPYPLLLRVAAGIILPFALIVAAFIFLRGHQLPGGGFVAALVVACAVLLHRMATGQVSAGSSARWGAQSLMAAGLMLAGATGIGAWLFARPFLTSSFGAVRLPPFREFELATAMAFDAGVFLTVLGASLLAIGSLSQLGGHSDAYRDEPGAM